MQSNKQYKYESPRPLGAWAIGTGKIPGTILLGFENDSFTVIVSEPLQNEVLNDLELRPAEEGYYFLSYGDLLCKARLADSYGDEDLVDYGRKAVEKHAVKDIMNGLQRHKFNRLYSYNEVKKVVDNKITELFS